MGRASLGVFRVRWRRFFITRMRSAAELGRGMEYAGVWQTFVGWPARRSTGP